MRMGQTHAATLKVIQGGRITIPTEVRELENIQEGDYVRVTIEKIERQTKQ
jgi:AbrB family looped-hinge helix DNA binding protein